MHFRIHWSHADMKGTETEYLSVMLLPVVISVPLKGSRWYRHRFAAQDGRLAQMGWHVLHVCDHGRVCGGKRPTQTDGRENKAISIRLRKGEVQSGRPRSPAEHPRERTKLGFMNSGIIMHGRIYMYINNTSSCYNSGGPVRVEILAPGCFAARGGSTYS